MVASCGKLILRREVDSEFIELKNGRYAVIPCLKTKDKVKDYSLRFYFDCDKKLGEVSAQDKGKKSAQFGKDSEIIISSANLKPEEYVLDGIAEEEENYIPPVYRDEEFKKLLQENVQKAVQALKQN